MQCLAIGTEVLPVERVAAAGPGVDFGLGCEPVVPTLARCQLIVDPARGCVDEGPVGDGVI